jgi:hypothetical protein
LNRSDGIKTAEANHPSKQPRISDRAPNKLVITPAEPAQRWTEIGSAVRIKDEQSREASEPANQVDTDDRSHASEADQGIKAPSRRGIRPSAARYYQSCANVDHRRRDEDPGEERWIMKVCPQPSPQQATVPLFLPPVNQAAPRRITISTKVRLLALQWLYGGARRPEGFSFSFGPFFLVMQ